MTTYHPIGYIEGEGYCTIKDGDGELVEFKSQKAVDNYCLKNKCVMQAKHEITYYMLDYGQN